MTRNLHRLSALALLVLVLGAASRLAVLPAWRTYQADGERIVEQADLVVRFERLAAALEPLRAQHAELESRARQDRLTLDGASVTLAAADLQERVKATVRAHGGRLVSTQVLDGDVEETFERVTLDVRMHLTVPALQKVLHGLESERPYLFLDELSVQVLRARQRRPNPASQAGVLDVRVRVTGYLPPGAGRPRAGEITA